MLKRTITYTDFNDQQVTETLYFNITKTELAGHLEMKDKLEEMQRNLSGPPRDLTTKEVQEILDLVKFFMKTAYGLRSEDGRRFKKSEEIWEDFTQTAAYDEFLFSLFEKPEAAVNFLIEVLPADLRDAASRLDGVKELQEPSPVVRGEMTVTAPIETVKDAPLKRLGDYSDEEILALDDESFNKLVGTDPKQMNTRQLQLKLARG
jgi:hypothetical protein